MPQKQRKTNKQTLKTYLKVIFYLLNYFKETITSQHLALNSCSVRMQYSARNVNISKIITLHSWGKILKRIILI